MKTANILIGQSGGPTAVINSSLSGVIKAAAEMQGIDKIYGMRFAIEGLLQRDLLDLSCLSAGELQGLRETPGSALGSSRYKLQDSDLPKVKAILEEFDIRYFFLIGGNDTMDTIYRIEQYCHETGYELTGVGIPKTVDNDLFGTDHTPGYASAARYIALSVQQAGRLADDMQKVDRYTVFQTVGREAGWLAAAAALAKKKESDAPHLIYFPERPLSRQRTIVDVKRTIEKYGWCYIVVGEGALWDDGTPVSAAVEKDKFSNLEFGAMGGASAALSLHTLLREETGYRGEFQITESLPMCAIDRTSRLDLDEAYSCGHKAVELAGSGETGVMVTMRRVSNNPYKIEFGTEKLENVAIKAKPLPESFINAEGNFPTKEFFEYAAPLVGEFSEYITVRGLNPAVISAGDRKAGNEYAAE
ncbi:MAG: diphosphate--fructose-6-phosphate 1-phosphotransferase [Spirochaetia bacterium]|nr:diphosphate--fructose-6-phosphate 1-phosphotransferase [Spirochaetia bacterium]